MGDLPACWMGPGARGYSALEANFHQLMIGRMKLDLIDALAQGVEGFQARRVFVSLSSELPGMVRPGLFRKGGEMGHMVGSCVSLIAVCIAPCKGGHERFSQGRVLQGIKIAGLPWLIGDVVRG